MRVSDEIATVLQEGAPADTPAGFESIAGRLSAADTSLLHIYSRLYDADAMKDLQRMAESDTDPANAELDALPPDADEATRENLAERLGRIIAQNLIDYPWLSDPSERMNNSERATKATFLTAVSSLYSEAQRDVLARA